ncbi:UNVERIFIED_CONTAM: hypothetical protein ABIC26_004753, partial [Paenibacillus sp. PvR008]
MNRESFGHAARLDGAGAKRDILSRQFQHERIALS